MRAPSRAVVVVVLMFGASGCDGSGGDPAADLYGEWRTNPGSIMSFLEDGSFNTVYAPWGPEPFGWGTYTFDGQTLTLVTTGGDRGCPEGQTGIYEARFTDDNSLSLSLVEEECGARTEIAASPMIRQSP